MYLKNPNLVIYFTPEHMQRHAHIRRRHHLSDRQQKVAGQLNAVLNSARRARMRADEVDACERNGIEIVFGVGGFDKPQSSSWLIGKEK